MPNKIIDCFLFYNELDMLKFRLDYLYDTVDYFVILESTLTFTGEQKELLFEKNKSMYEAYQDKIIHVIVDDLPSDDPTKSITDNAWIREKFQRNSLHRGISKLHLNDDDVIVITDVDEIPDRKTLALLRKMDKIENIVYALEQDMYYYNLSCKITDKWHHAKFVNYHTYHDIFKTKSEDIRMVGRYALVKRGGWHLSYFGNVNFIQNKIKSFSHQEYNDEKYTSAENITNCIKYHKDLFARGNEHSITYCALEDNDYLPETYRDLVKISMYV
jgi:beta-1,4-mannosyl-glycoprotein beta-1,4-N-acetylglucosaminyltransferase